MNRTERFTVAEFFRDLYMREKTVPVVEEIYWAADTPETEKATVLNRQPFLQCSLSTIRCPQDALHGVQYCR